MDIRAIINEILIMSVLIVVILIAAYMLFYNQIPKTVDEPVVSKYTKVDEIDDALVEIEESIEDKSILNIFTGQTIYKRKYESGKVNPFDRSPNTLYVKPEDVVATPGNTSTGNTASGSTGGVTGGNNTSSGGKLTNTTGK